MTNIELAKEYGIRVCQSNNLYEFYDVTNLQLEAFATAIVKQAIEDYKASLVPVAWMWQHEENGNIGFIDQWQIDNGFEKGNPRLSIISQVYKLPSGETK